MASWHPKDASDQQAVREQLERLLRDPLFAHSKRYPALLRYVVEKSLCGEDADLKERTIGVEAFGRTPNYDTNADTIVRVAAGEIRRRLAQYYYCAGHEEELRIELNSGSYVPEFYPADGSVQSPAAPTISPQLLEAPAKEAAKADVSEAPLIDNSIASILPGYGLLLLQLPFALCWRSTDGICISMRMSETLLNSGNQLLRPRKIHCSALEIVPVSICSASRLASRQCWHRLLVPPYKHLIN
jgi:hypothetical protein